MPPSPVPEATFLSPRLTRQASEFFPRSGGESGRRARSVKWRLTTVGGVDVVRGSWGSSGSLRKLWVAASLVWAMLAAAGCGGTTVAEQLHAAQSATPTTQPSATVSATVGQTTVVLPSPTPASPAPATATPTPRVTATPRPTSPATPRVDPAALPTVIRVTGTAGATALFRNINFDWRDPDNGASVIVLWASGVSALEAGTTAMICGTLECRDLLTIRAGAPITFILQRDSPAVSPHATVLADGSFEYTVSVDCSKPYTVTLNALILDRIGRPTNSVSGQLVCVP